MEAASSVVDAWTVAAPWASITAAHGVVSARAQGRRHRWSIRSWPETTATALDEGEVLVAADLGPRIRGRLARAGRSFVDNTTLHLVDGPVLIHLEDQTAAHASSEAPVAATKPLPPAGVRAVEAMLIVDRKAWTVRQLADVADVSVGSAHRVLTTLERAGLAISRGTGTARSRLLGSRSRVLDWLADQPVATRVPLSWPGSLYGRNDRDVVTRAAEALLRAGFEYAVTGMAAASLTGVGATALDTVHIWVDGEAELAAAASAAGIRRVDRGANIVLRSDANGSGTFRTELIDHISVAARPRVYLDLLGEPRGPEVATAYRRSHLDY